MAEMEIHWKEEHEMLVQKSLEDARSGDDVYANEIKELRQSLDEAIEKSTAVQADLLQAEQCRDDFVSKNEQLSNDLQDAQRQYQQISIDDERLVKDCDAAKAESRALDLELSVVQNTLQEKETEVARLSELNESQAADFDQEKMKLDDEIVGATVLIQNLMNQLETDSNADDVASKEHERKLSEAAQKIVGLSDDVETLQNDKHQIQGSLGICEVEKVAAQSKNQDLLEKLQ
jgi:chromosome segregation ATPase